MNLRQPGSKYPIILNKVNEKYYVNIKELGLTVSDTSIQDAYDKIINAQNELVQDYQKSGIELPPVKKGSEITKIVINTAITVAVSFALIYYFVLVNLKNDVFQAVEKINNTITSSSDLLVERIDKSLNWATSNYYELQFEITALNDYDGILQFHNKGTSWDGRAFFREVNRWEELKNISINKDKSELTFLRPLYKQVFTGKITVKGDYKGVFIQNKKTTGKWSAKIIR